MQDTHSDVIKSALLTAAGGKDQHIIGAEQLANAIAYLLELFKAELQSAQHASAQQYGSITQLATRYGKSVNTLKVWARQLEAEGAIKPLQGAPNKAEAKGDAMYSFAEFDKALRERRKQWNTKMNNQSA